MMISCGLMAHAMLGMETDVAQKFFGNAQVPLVMLASGLKPEEILKKKIIVAADISHVVRQDNGEVESYIAQLPDEDTLSAKYYREGTFKGQCFASRFLRKGCPVELLVNENYFYLLKEQYQKLHGCRNDDEIFILPLD